MNLYAQVLEQAHQARVRANRQVRTARRKARLDKFVASIDRPTWVRNGRIIALRR